ncbi:hypothetical protein [Sideroxydans sp. CL21]|uniref:hypothetical protein n=1 Tax=Sideroxydans sp. CL21 TaxID=2600596 RepID=UPI0024BC93D3|nr:hypothetical protein [Sideroxydans sp. CL21]
MKYLLIAAIALVLSGCTTNRSNVDPWVGHKISEVESEFGVPTSSSDSGDGLRVITWEFANPRRTTNICRKSFTVDGAGIISRSSFSGCSFYFSE